MAFTIQFDYRFDSSGFFDSPDRRAILQEAAAQWEAAILDELDDLPVGTSFQIRNPTTDAVEIVTLANSVDDVIIFVGARNLSGASLAFAGPDGVDAIGDVYSARISSDFRDTGPVTDFEPWAGTITFDNDTNWSFDLGEPDFNESDFLSVAIHEIGHILGVGTSAAFDEWIVNDTFTGPNAMAINNGQPIPIESDGGHVEDGFAGDTVSLDPTLNNGTRVLVSEYDKALLADIGYEIAGFTKQGTTPPIATNADERIFGRDVADTIDGLDGNDTLQGEGGDDLLLGNSGNDDLFGQIGNDTLIGGVGDDYLAGGSGDDELRGGEGLDIYFGDHGTDVFVIEAGGGHNTISDFELDGEIIRLVNSGFESSNDAANAITKISGNISRLTLTDGTTIDVFHTSQSETPLTAAHFKLLDADDVPVVLTIDGDASANDLQGGDGNEVISGYGSDDSLSGGAGEDTLSGGSGADVFDVNPGDEKINITDFEIAQDVLDLSGFERSDVAAALMNAKADDGTVLTFSDGTVLSIVGPDVTTQSIFNASILFDRENYSPEGPLVILGDALEGETLLARINSIKDEDGIDFETASFQWYRDGEIILGEQDQSYDVSEVDRGTEISVEWTYLDHLGTNETITSDPKPAVPGNKIDDLELSESPILDGTSDEDVLIALAGHERIDGFGGDDTVFFEGDQANYIVSFGPDGVSVTDKIDGGLGTIALDNIEFIDFGTGIDAFGGPIDLNMFGGHTALDEGAFESFVEMYIAYFNRAPDAIGLSFWGTAFAQGLSLEEIAAEFAGQPETLASYPADFSNIRLAADVYQNVLGRAPDIDGLRFWTGALDNGDVTRAEFILEVLRGAKAEPPADASQSFVERQSADQLYLEQKTDIGALYAVHKGMSNTGDAATVLALFDGSQESLDAAVQAIEVLHTAAMAPENGDFLMPLVGVLDDPFSV